MGTLGTQPARMSKPRARGGREDEVLCHERYSKTAAQECASTTARRCADLTYVKTSQRPGRDLARLYTEIKSREGRMQSEHSRQSGQLLGTQANTFVSPFPSNTHPAVCIWAKMIGLVV